ncbi:MAG: class I SAM-dependent methyltransferase [Anaerolineales bacterium]
MSPRLTLTCTTLEKVKQHILATNVQIIDANQTPISKLRQKSFDLINALGVLEHVQDARKRFAVNRLKPNGQHHVRSAENFLYQIGRKIAGLNIQAPSRARHLTNQTRTQTHRARRTYCHVVSACAVV